MYILQNELFVCSLQDLNILYFQWRGYLSAFLLKLYLFISYTFYFYVVYNYLLINCFREV